MMLPSRVIPAAAVSFVLLLPGAALAAADLQRGTQALRAAYESTEADEGGYGGTLVEQCRAESESVVRCVIVQGEGNRDIDSHESSETRAPVDFGVARFGPDDRITTAREPFLEAPRTLDADIRVAPRLRRTRSGQILVRVAPDVPATVTVGGWFGAREIRRQPPRTRTVHVPGGKTTKVALALTRAQRARIRSALRRTGSIRAVISVSVVGDVGPADATQSRTADVRIVR